MVRRGRIKFFISNAGLEVNVIYKIIKKEVDLMKKHALLVFSIAFLAIGILGIIGVGFFHSNQILEIIEIVLGGVGLLLVFGRMK